MSAIGVNLIDFIPPAPQAAASAEATLGNVLAWTEKLIRNLHEYAEKLNNVAHLGFTSMQIGGTEQLAVDNDVLVLESTGAASVTLAGGTITIGNDGLLVQYSVDGVTNWHDPPFAGGDVYMRQSFDNGQSWSAAIKMVGDDGSADWYDLTNVPVRFQDTYTGYTGLVLTASELGFVSNDVPRAYINDQGVIYAGNGVSIVSPGSSYLYFDPNAGGGGLIFIRATDGFLGNDESYFDISNGVLVLKGTDNDTGNYIQLVRSTDNAAFDLRGGLMIGTFSSGFWNFYRELGFLAVQGFWAGRAFSGAGIGTNPEVLLRVEEGVDDEAWFGKTKQLNGIDRHLYYKEDRSPGDGTTHVFALRGCDLDGNCTVPTGTLLGAVAAANGGTGQTGFNKGDLLAAAAATTLNRLAAGSDGEVLTAAAAQAAGVKWSRPVGYKTGTYSGNGSTLNVDLGIAADLVFVRRTDANENWVLVDADGAVNSAGAGRSASISGSTLVITNGNTNINGGSGAYRWHAFQIAA